MSDHVNEGYNFTGEIAIISGFPCIGKSKFAQDMANAYGSVISVIDYDIGDYRAKYPHLSGDELYDAYVAEIDTIYNNLKLSRMYAENKTILQFMKEFNIKPGTDRFKEIASKNPVTAFILVSSHEEVRKRLTASEFQFYYMRPTIHQLGFFTETARERMENDPENKSAERAYMFMRDHAGDIIRDDYYSEYQKIITIDYPYFMGQKLDEMTDYFTVWEYNLRNVLADKVRASMDMALKDDDIHATFPDITIDARGRIVVRSAPLTKEQLVGIMNMCDVPTKLHMCSAYNHQSFITLTKGDGEALFMLLSKLAKECKGTTNSYDAFGPNGISYERLYDRLVGTSYPLWPGDDQYADDADEDSD